MTDTPAPTMGLAEAARACGVSVSTLRRRKSALVTAGATVSTAGWSIPIPALVSLGYLSGTTPPDTPSPSAVTPATTPPVDTPLTPPSELEELRSRLAEAERRAAVAEAVAAERERLIQSQASALRMLESGTPATPPAATPDTSHDTPSETPDETPRDTPESPVETRSRSIRSWFRRR